MNHDVVYIVRDGFNNELKHSLRSVERNFPHRNLVIYGGQPFGVKPDRLVRIEQQGDEKWSKVRYTLRIICDDNNLTEDIWLFNDDFFIMQPIDNPQNYYDKRLIDWIESIEAMTYGAPSEYTKRLRAELKTLQDAGIAEPLNYEHHTPMLINRKKMAETLDRYPECPLFRALYGNLHQIGGIDMPDVKFHQKRQPWPLGAYASTSDESWNTERIGFVIRDRFMTPSKWEIIDG